MSGAKLGAVNRVEECRALSFLGPAEPPRSPRSGRGAIPRSRRWRRSCRRTPAWSGRTRPAPYPVPLAPGPASARLRLLWSVADGAKLVAVVVEHGAHDFEEGHERSAGDYDGHADRDRLLGDAVGALTMTQHGSESRLKVSQLRNSPGFEPVHVSSSWSSHAGKRQRNACRRTSPC